LGTILPRLGGFGPLFLCCAFVVVVDSVAVSTEDYALFGFFAGFFVPAILHQFVDTEFFCTGWVVEI